MAFTPPGHTPYQWHNAPTTDTPLDAAHLETAENDLVSYTQTALEAYDSYAQAQFAQAAPFVSAAANGIAAANSASANATALSALIGSSGALGNGGTLMCDWVGTAVFDTTVASLIPHADFLFVRGQGWDTIMKLAPENSTSQLALWKPGGSTSMQFYDIVLQGPTAVGAGGANSLILHNGTAGQIRLNNVWLHNGTFLCQLNPSTSGSNVSLHATNCWFQGYGSGGATNATTCIGAFDPTPSAWTPPRRVNVDNCRFFGFGDPSGGALKHALYVYTSWGLHVSNCSFDTPASTSTGYCAQHYDGGVVTGTAIAKESEFLGCSFGANLGTTKGLFTNGNYLTKVINCNFENGGLSTFASDIEVGGDVLIANSAFAHKDAQNIEFQAASTAQIDNCIFMGALGGGCASIYNNVNGAVVKIDNCRFTGGTGANGNYCWLASTGEMQIRECRFEGNPQRAVHGTAAGIMSVLGSRFTVASTCIGNASTSLAQLWVRNNDFAPSSGASGVFGLTVTPTILGIVGNFGSVGFPTESGATFSTTTSGTSVSIAHGLGNSSLAVTPTKFTVQPGNAATAALSAPAITATSTNIVLTYPSSIASAAYSWNWTAAR